MNPFTPSAKHNFELQYPLQDLPQSQQLVKGLGCLPEKAQKNSTSIIVRVAAPKSRSFQNFSSSMKFLQKRGQQLCKICEGIDFKEYFRRAIDCHVYEDGFVGANKNALRLGFFEEIVQRSSSCSFCYLVAMSICRRRSSWLFSPQQKIAADRKRGFVMECWMYSYIYAEHDPTEPGPETSYRIGIATRKNDEGPSKSEDLAGDIQLLADDASQVGKPRLFHGRAIDAARMDGEMVRKWLGCCEVEHGELCAIPKENPDTRPENLLVVDVENLCICHLPPDSSYICLSYCWPKKKPFTLTYAERDQLFQPRSLNQKLWELPYAIRDAIDCVSELGEKYLWVDSLCITQDDEYEKRFQISQMHKIFTFAFLTLVSASSIEESNQDPYSGLPRYRKYTGSVEQELEKIGTLQLAVPFETLSFTLEDTKWSTRKWTFEEQFLSRRLLFFTRTQVYFQCRSSIFCEDAIGEGSRPCARIYPKSNLWNLGSPFASQISNSNFGSFHLRRQEHTSVESAISEYFNFVPQYTQRDLTYSSDILNAFKGIEGVMKQTMRTHFWYGLPEKFLDAALLWTLVGPHKKREVTIKGFHESHFPSWTWAGWDSEVELGSYFLFSRLGREVHWYLENQKGEVTRMATIDSPEELQSAHDGLGYSAPQGKLPYHLLAAEKSKTEVDQNPDDWKYPKYLACLTTLAEFNLTGRITSLGQHDTVWPNGFNLAISDKRNRWVGCIIMDRNWVKDCLPMTRCEFVLLSRSEIIFDSLYPEMKYFDEETFVKKPWCILNVMLIERKCDIAQRLGVGLIHDIAWSEAGPRSLFIRLK